MAVNTSSRVQTEVHRSICTFFLSSLCSWDQQHLDGELPNCPRAQGHVSPQGMQDNVQEDARFKVNIAGEARKAELVPKGSSACSRSDGIAGVPSLGALSVTCSPRPAPAPDPGPPSLSHRAPTLLLYKSYFAAQQSKIWNKK